MADIDDGVRNRYTGFDVVLPPRAIDSCAFNPVRSGEFFVDDWRAFPRLGAPTTGRRSRSSKSGTNARVSGTSADLLALVGPTLGPMLRHGSFVAFSFRGRGR